ncbi:hypothetical protein KL909_003000 [Ogataea angusta]|uniref:Cell wall protein ECM33 n=1 Tax=Pichia angusta TaxID=870730 RepID=A0AAN6DFS1_PICAN|nr:uncharacterized protein KL928_004020 [Ogataea angusta]KAG7817285.1 hypothetical protein KL928_004020 [Ogataea angusta]KAG7823603.1 hypothetical protein KL909_003000 [Ogataea angusta]KAG7828790.1 hypothetical protein KL920_003286 [Ogataea angusta]KAG7857802.1 hypothetical protein KL939_003058 [Ogataea angusta]
MQFKLALLALAGYSTLTSTTSISVPSGCSFSKTLTATAQSDLDDLSSCSAIEGDIYITGDLSTASIANVKAIYGSLSAFNCSNLQSLRADSLTTITKQLELTDLYVLDTLSFGSLVSVGSINWVTLPALTQAGLAAGVSDCQSIYISDTQLESLDGFNPINVETFNINNNKNLASISSDIQSISNALSVSYNGDDTNVTFDSLSWANNITFYSVSSISMSNISTVNSSLGVFESNVESLAIPSLKKIGGDLSIIDNDDLTEIDFSDLTSVGGGFVIANNSNLETIDGFDSLTTIGGAVILKGDFDNATFPKLSTVRGGFDLETTGEADCDEFNTLEKKGGIQGDKFVCSAATESSSSINHSKTSGSSSATSSGSSDESTSSGASSSSQGGAAVNTISVFGIMSALLLALL